MSTLLSEVSKLFLDTMTIVNSPHPIPNFPVTEEGNAQLRQIITDRRKITTKMYTLMKQMGDFDKERGTANFATMREQLNSCALKMMEILEDEKKLREATSQS